MQGRLSTARLKGDPVFRGKAEENPEAAGRTDRRGRRPLQENPDLAEGRAAHSRPYRARRNRHIKCAIGHASLGIAP